MRGGNRYLASRYSHTLNTTLDLSANLHAVSAGLGTDALPVPSTVPAALIEALRHFAAGSLILYRAYVNGQLDAQSARDDSAQCSA